MYNHRGLQALKATEKNLDARFEFISSREQTFFIGSLRNSSSVGRRSRKCRWRSAAGRALVGAAPLFCFNVKGQKHKKLPYCTYVEFKFLI